MNNRILLLSNIKTYILLLRYNPYDPTMPIQLMVQEVKLCFHPFLDASHLQLVYATLYVITAAKDLSVQGCHIYQI